MARERVQVQGLCGSVPGISPTIQRAGQYSVAQVRAGRNKLQDLADALSTVNPILQQYGQIRQFQQERDIAAGQQFFAERPEEAVESLQAGLGKTKRELRKLADQGVIDERSNPDFLLGIRAARGKTLAKDFRRELLTNPDAMNQEDPVGYIQQQIADFYQRPEIAGSTYAKQQVQPVLESISNEYIGQVTRVQQDREIAQGKADWLGSIVDEVKAWSGNRALLSDDVFKQWIDDGAGNFKGSRKYALDNLFKPVIMDMVEQGNTGGAMRKLRDLENWVINKDTGAKFVTAELMDDINNMQAQIINSGSHFRNLSTQMYADQRKTAEDPFAAEFLQRLNNSQPITEAFFTDWATRVRNGFQDQGLKSRDAENFITQFREEANKSYNRAQEKNIVTDPDAFALIQGRLGLGLESRELINDLLDEDKLSFSDYKSLLKSNDDESNFEKNVMGLPPVRDYTDQVESAFSNTIIKGGVPVLNKNTNFIKELLELDRRTEIHPTTLGTLGLKAKNIWRDRLRQLRERIINANPDITRSQLDTQITQSLATEYEGYNAFTQEVIRNELKSGQYDLGIKKTEFDKFKSGKPSDAFKSLITNLQFTSKEEASLFISNYLENHL
jgi:hypothetical protein